MYKNELLASIKEQGKGLINTKRDYKIILDAASEKAKKENRQYDYSEVYSIVYDGKNSVKITYTDMPSINESKDHDKLKQYTDFQYITLTLDDIKNLTFIDLLNK